ncbi:hypothetical protein ASF61_12630 [Duganella sp. Leaf126]|uniref:NF038120 family PEP-CTERM protein n=1 Tax=Duganella sp. Leaf126 TaxID=1736266 RepID=UPI0006F5F7B1|nr:NF038120 family PEP-CTERM protein [Duganella sp. Leaf126]KQQ32935.1 hypothetical protein ASF61_12630 [Duganella sp. Leaf126]
MTFIQSKLRRLTAATVGALALMSAVPAMAGVIDFESIAPSIYGGTDVITESGYNMTVIDSPAAGPSGTGFAGAIGNGSDPFLCTVAACPTGNASQFYLGVNDGSLKLERADNRLFQLTAIDYAFLAPVGGLASGSYGQLTLTGKLASGGDVTYAYNFPALNSQGNSPFQTLSLTGFGGSYFSSVTIGSCLFDVNGACANPLAGAENQSQFAIDNLRVAPVPEPETYALMGLGLGLVGWMSRRRTRAARANTIAA